MGLLKWFMGTSLCLVHTLLTAKTLSGFSTPEDIASRIVVKNGKLVAEPYIEGNSVKVKFKTGLVIMFY